MAPTFALPGKSKETRMQTKKTHFLFATGEKNIDVQFPPKTCNKHIKPSNVEAPNKIIQTVNGYLNLSYFSLILMWTERCPIA